MSFLEHLEELRWTVVWIILATVAASVGGWYVADEVITYLSDDLSRILARATGTAARYDLHVFEVSEAFTVKFKVALLLGLMVALPLSDLQGVAVRLPGPLLKGEAGGRAADRAFDPALLRRRGLRLLRDGQDHRRLPLQD